MELVQMKRKQQYIKAYCLMYPWYIYEAHCEWVEAVTYASPGPRRSKQDKFKHGRHCLKWLTESDVISMSDQTSLNSVLRGDIP